MRAERVGTLLRIYADGREFDFVMDPLPDGHTEESFIASCCREVGLLTAPVDEPVVVPVAVPQAFTRPLTREALQSTRIDAPVKRV